MSLTHLHYFAGGNTAKGFYPLLDSNLQGLNCVYILEDGPKTLKSDLLKNLGMYWEQKQHSIEWLHCSSDHHLIDGIIIRSLKIAIIDGEVPYIMKTPSDIAQKRISFHHIWDSEKLFEYQEEIEKLQQKMENYYKLAYTAFSEALAIHDEWERIYIENMDFKKANRLTEEWIQQLFPHHSSKHKASEYHRFLGAATSVGPIDFIDDLTKNVQTRYFIKGRPGSGKSTMLKKIARAAKENGFDVEIYHCGFDPNSLDMVIVRKLGFAIFDSTAPHEYFPTRENDSIIDMYQELIKRDTDERYARELKDISSRYTDKMKKGTSYLYQAKTIHDQIEHIYEKAIDSQKVHEIKNDIYTKIETING